MTVLIHVLGSDIPHHNRTLLCFFNDELAPVSSEARIFMVVGQDNGLSAACPALSLTFFSNKTMLAKAVMRKARANREQRFFFHGQFNSDLWLGLLRGAILPVQFNWHIWGADLYGVSRAWKFRLFYPIRRFAQRRLSCVFGSRGDLSFFAKLDPKIRREVLYFPTRMDSGTNIIPHDVQRDSKLTILLGNSGDHSNEHIFLLNTVYKQFGDTVNVIVPMGYPANNEAYINKVHQHGLGLFSLENFCLLRKKLPFSNYLSLLQKCDLGYFVFSRQQGIGTLCLLIQAGIPCVLNRENPFWQDMVEQNIPILFTTDILNKEVVREAQRQLALLDKNTIDFFYPNYLVLWHQALQIASGRKQ